MNHYFRDKVILVTGAASGIGNRFAERVAGLEPRALILWDRNPDTLAVFEKQLPDGVTVISHGVDVSDYSSISHHAELLKKEGLVPDLVLNCAGVVTGEFFHDHTADQVSDTLQINTTGTMWVVHAFIKEMIERGSGHVVNLASASGYIGNPRMSVYAASKWAVLGWSQSLRLEMERLGTGIAVTEVIPSYIKTGMFDGVKAPLLVPLLETDRIVDMMLKGIARRKKKIQAPFMVKFVPLIKALLPARAFDWVAGSLLGVYRSMDSFEGRKKEKA